MKCSECNRRKKVHFTTEYCSWCETDIAKLRFYRGYIVYREDGMHSPHHVFKHVNGARKWLHAHALKNARVEKVLSPTPFTWQNGGDLVPGEKIANRNYYVVETHKFNPEQPFIIFASKKKKKPAMPMPPDESVEDNRSEGERLRDFFATSLNR